MAQALSALPRADHPRVLIGFDTSDDAGIFELTPDCALVQTVDFFTPIVDDPFQFGAIAAANSLSDVYAMGGEPLTALSILCYPPQDDLQVLQAILAGGADKLNEAGCALLGGHSVADDTIKFGYSVTGTVHPARIRANSHARPGDALVLTKPLGTGLIATALKRGLANPDHVAASLASMLTLNRDAARAMASLAVHGCTDISGFGLLGHAREMALASHLTLEIDSRLLPILPGALPAIAAGAIPGGLNNNRSFASPSVFAAPGVDPALLTLLYDPQTSGGLLVSLPPEDAHRLIEAIPAALIGQVSPRKDHALWVL
ncbi:MAG: selenide, water dikinase SelD [Bryobacter sp.]|nr:selenide, water dikinase SelD [Bryobacter sp. CoA8 C33]